MPAGPEFPNLVFSIARQSRASPASCAHARAGLCLRPFQRSGRLLSGLYAASPADRQWPLLCSRRPPRRRRTGRPGLVALRRLYLTAALRNQKHRSVTDGHRVAIARQHTARQRRSVRCQFHRDRAGIGAEIHALQVAAGLASLCDVVTRRKVLNLKTVFVQ